MPTLDPKFVTGLLKNDIIPLQIKRIIVGIFCVCRDLRRPWLLEENLLEAHVKKLVEEGTQTLLKSANSVVEEIVEGANEQKSVAPSSETGRLKSAEQKMLSTLKRHPLDMTSEVKVISDEIFCVINLFKQHRIVLADEALVKELFMLDGSER